ncbi:hypothetical protein [Pseudoxanthomonas sp. Root630]|uniref:hypothetical protein n=1 Tax=Pseudoxanthomonas sp. Root630 TaxID=1736574 RepID=UPI0007038B0B|nr:hypothetical protein [Pseudoxanthomonas sp. Root630]KRA42739.1 hypothetical protein ASD72_11585 [Pseudoxanthomonas sp. Root630]
MDGRPEFLQALLPAPQPRLSLFAMQVVASDPVDGGAIARWACGGLVSCAIAILWHPVLRTIDAIGPMIEF